MTIVWASSFWLFGIYAGRQLPLLPLHWIILTLVAAIAAAVLWRFPTYRTGFALLFFLTLAAARSRASVKKLSPDDLGYYNDLEATATITGVVMDDPDRRASYTALRLRAERLVIPSLDLARTIHGDVLVYAHQIEDWSYGDWVRVKGKLETPPVLDDFSYAEYLARKGIFSWMPQAYTLKLGAGRGNLLLEWIYDLRRHLLATVYHIFPDPEASLVAGILLGIESGISTDLYEEFNRTGTTHIIAISGFNITIIANLFISLSRRFFGSRRGIWVAATAIGLYTVLVGADAAVVRAAVMGGLALLARASGRETLGLASLGISSVLMTVVTPSVLWDVGFELSFAAALGLVLYAQPLQDRAINLLARWMSPERADKIGGLLAEYFLYTLAALITTWPLTMLYFRRFTFSAWVTNPLILPLQPALMILSGVATLIGVIWMPGGRILALLAWPFPALTIRIVSYMARYATAGLGISGVSYHVAIGYYAALIGATALARFSTGHRPAEGEPGQLWAQFSTHAVPLLGVAALATTFVWHSAARAPDGRLHVTFFDVGAGDAILIRTPGGQRVLIDGGESPTRLMEHLGAELPLLARKIDWLILGGTRSNQVSALIGLVNHISVKQALLPPTQGGGALERLRQELSNRGVDTYTAAAGQSLDLGMGASLDILYCGENGSTMQLRYGDARILLTPGMTPAALPPHLTDTRTKSVSVLLLPDGGHGSVNSSDWISHTQPQVVVISTSADEIGSRPSEEVLELLEGRSILRTDQHGTIEIQTDGEVLWVEVERLAGK